MKYGSLTQDELTRLLTTAKAQSYRNWLMLLVGFSHGLRISEILGLTATNVRDGFLVVKRLKGSETTTQPLLESGDPLFNERAALEIWCKKNPSGPLFNLSRQRAWQIIQRLGKLTSVPSPLCHPHILKHTLAQLSIHTAGIENVRQMLGHKSMSSTGAYLKVDDVKATKAVYKALEGIV